jgi:glycosyltransferase involved in cell wall biosynthesis
VTPLRIGVNALYLIPGGVGGTEIYLRRVLAALAELDHEDEYFVFTNRETAADLAPDRPNFHAMPQPVRAVIRPVRILWEQTGLPLAAGRLRLDVLFNPGFTAPVFCGCPQITTFHDLQHKRHPEYFRPLDLPFWRFCLWAAAHRSRILMAASEATRADLLHFYRLDAAKIRVVPYAADAEFFEIARERENSEVEPYFLSPSTSHPHKGLVPLLRAFAEVRRAHPEFRLVITGVRGFHDQAVAAAIEELALGESVRMAGWVPREELYKLFRHAFGFVYPSTFEGFGIPVVEALAAGVPAACSRIEPLTSVAGGAALHFEPADEADIAAVLSSLINDAVLRARLAVEGPRRAREFTWENTARAVLEAIRLTATAP